MKLVLFWLFLKSECQTTLFCRDCVVFIRLHTAAQFIFICYCLTSVSVLKSETPFNLLKLAKR